MNQIFHWGAACAVGILLLCANPEPGHTKPQLNVALAPGICATTQNSETHLCFYGALRTDIMLLRESAADIGLGPSLELATAGFDDLRIGIAPSLQLPINSVQAVLSAGPSLLIRREPEAGVHGRLFLGSRSYNYYGSYIATFGVVAGLDLGLTTDEQTFFVAAQIDGMWLSLPFLILYHWAKGPTN